MINTLICGYCETKTTGLEGAEHLIPESLGGNITLYKGALCGKCNNYFSTLESKILGNPFIQLGQIVTDARGKKGLRDFNLKGGGKITKLDNGFSWDGNGGTFKLDENEHEISRLLAKMFINTCIHRKGTEDVIANFPKQKGKISLREYARYGGGTKNHIWPYAGIITPLPVKSSSHIMPTNNRPFGALICASGMFCMPLELNEPSDLTIADSLITTNVNLLKSQGISIGTSIRFAATQKLLK